jgi:hypothetical protein
MELVEGPTLADRIEHGRYRSTAMTAIPRRCKVMKAWILLGALFLCGCSRGLSHDEALRVISGHKALRASDNVSVDAISSTSASEAIVRTTIAGETLNLKLRKFDTGWTWEFAETKGGGWIAPDVAIAQVREIRRVEAAGRRGTKAHTPRPLT